MSIVINALNNSLIKLDQNTPCVTFYCVGHTFALGLYDGTQITDSHKWDGRIFYSYDKRNWHELNGVIRDPNNIIHLCGIDNTQISNDGISGSFSAIHFFDPYNYSSDPGCDITCVGDLATLLDFRKYSSGGTLVAPDHSFRYAFRDCLGLVSVQKIGFTDIGYAAFEGTFYNCTDLRTPPSLPATTLDKWCYNWMFYGCSSLERLPKLKATTVPDYAYNGMFAYSGATLKATQDSEYQYEFRIPASGTGTIGEYALQDMFGGTSPSINVEPNTTYYTVNPLVE